MLDLAHLILVESYLEDEKAIIKYLKNLRIYQGDKDSLKYLPYLLELKKTLK